MNFKRYHVSKNLLDVNASISGAIKGSPYTAQDYGTILSSQYTNTSDYIPITPNTQYTFRCNNQNPSATASRGYAFYDNNKQVIVVGDNTLYDILDISTLTVTTPNTAAYMRISWDINATNLMLNTGSTALPYEPYSSEVWHDTPHYIMGTSTDTITTLPAVIYANDTTATVGISGNMEQTGIPTPQNPIQPQSCGDRTGNLLSEKYENRSINSVGAFTIDNNFDLWVGEVVAGQIYTISNINAVYGFFTAKPMPNTGVTYNGSREIDSSGTVVITVPSGCTWIAVRVLHNADNAMLNTGSTALPYEPYGQYKIPILSANTTTPVYLGEVESTRRIKKYEFTGQENISLYGASATRVGFYLNRSDAILNGRTTGACSHFKPQATPASSNIDGITFGANDQNFYLTFSADSASTYSLTDIASIKAWLAAQYAAGTPVTVWYVLAEPTTGTVNEPIRKIGDYADAVNGITIPTIAGINSFDVLTTLKPSEVTANYHGWHTGAVHERDSGAWD